MIELRGAQGTYRVGDEPLAIGAQAEVWPATRADGAEVAVKVAHPTGSARRAIEEEARLLTDIAALGCAVPLWDRLDWDERPALVMPLAAGSLDARVRERVEAAPGAGLLEILAVVAELCRKLAVLHTAHVVHRDVKPENVLVAPDGSLWLCDFGGSLVVDELRPVRLGLFGSPLWAPFDQMLPGLPEPNPTWDTYAVCVMLLWWVTAGRPEYQEDPSPMLTARGREAWQGLRALAAADTDVTRFEAMKRLVAAQEGAREADLVDVRGHAAIQPRDRAAIIVGVGQLCAEPRFGAQAIALAAQDLAELMARGLSPLSHPSPPNRFWKAAELADEIDAVAARLRVAEAARQGQRREHSLERRVLSLEARRPSRPALAIAAAIAVVAAAGAAFWVASLVRVPAPEPAAEERVATVAVAGALFPAGDTFGDGEADERPVKDVSIGPFRIARTEVTNAAWEACVGAGACEVLPKSSEYAMFRGSAQPVVGVTWTEAGAWCAWAGGRLPGEAEWELAATWSPESKKAVDKRRWPWGDEPLDCVRANTGDCTGGITLPVGGRPAGASAYGALDLVGNAWEPMQKNEM